MYFYEDKVAEATKEAGLRGVCSATVMDLPVPGLKNADEGLREAEVFFKKWSGDSLIVPAVGPHAAYTVGPETLLRAKALADRYHAPLNIHAAESPSEMKMVKERYGLTTVTHLDRSASWARTSSWPTPSGCPTTRSRSWPRRGWARPTVRRAT